MRILITGNMGYVGPVLTRFLRSALNDAELIGFDAGFFGHSLTGAGLLPEALLDRQVFGDIREFPAEFLDGVDAVVHLSAVSNDPMGNKFEAVTGEINRDASVRIAQMAAERGVKNFVFASSCSMYGYAEGGARKESDPTNPLTAYARSKIGCENELAELNLDGMTVTSLRFATACGMSDRLRLDLVLNDFVACAIASGEITVLSDGTPWRPLIDVEDMARAISWAIVRKRENGRQVSGGERRPRREQLSGQRPGGGGRAPGSWHDGFHQHQRAPGQALLQGGLCLVPVAGAGLHPASFARSVDRPSSRRACRHGLRRPGFPQLAVHAAEDARAPHGGRPPRSGFALALPRSRLRDRAMKFHKTPLDGAYLIELEKRGDDRGFFARFFCENEFGAAGLETRFVQINNSLTAAKGTLRGLHYQLPPAAEVKVVRAIRGALWDVIVDLRAGSLTHRKWFGTELNENNRLMMYVPRGFGHGFVTLSDNVEALYLDSAFYSPEAERGLRWNDPAIGIDWPVPPQEMSDKDRNWPDLNPKFHGVELMRGLT